MVHVASGNGPSRPQRQAILILGMYRTGGSALAGVLRSLGAAAPKTLLMPSSGNPSGYWESVPLANAHDELLASAGSRWNDWRPFDPQWIHSKAAQAHKEKIRDILRDEYGDAPLFIIKDPRICRFVPFMSAVLSEMEVGTVVFLMLRNPVEIALSLRRRGGMALPRGLMLWLRHALDAEYHSRHMPRYFLSYEALLMGWRQHLDRAAVKIGIVWPDRSDASTDASKQLLSPNPQRERRDVRSPDEQSDVPPLVGQAYHLLRTMAADGESPELVDQIDAIRTKFDEGCDIFGPVSAAEELMIEQLRGEISQRTAESERMRASIEQQRIQWTQHDGNVQQLQEALSAATQRWQADRATASEQIAALHMLLKESESDRAGRLEHINTLTKCLKEAEADRAARLEHIENLTNSLKVSEADRAKQSKQRHQLGEELAVIYKSRSWRMTKPLRALNLLLRGNGASTQRE